MKTVYLQPQCEVIDVEETDIIVTSLGDKFYQDSDELIIDNGAKKYSSP